MGCCKTTLGGDDKASRQALCIFDRNVELQDGSLRLSKIRM